MTVAVWLLAGLLVLGGLIGYGLTFPQQAHLKEAIDAGKLTPAQRDELQMVALMSFMKGTFLLALASLFGGLCLFSHCDSKNILRIVFAYPLVLNQ